MPFRTKFLAGAVAFGLLTVATAIFAARPAAAEAQLLIEADTGKVLHQENATYPWYPASVTKLMTLYSAFRAVREHRLTLDTLLTVTPNAVAQQPTKMGFKAGTQVTVDNVIKMMMVKSANDMAVTLAEGVSGSVENFSDEMNRNAQRLGMTQSSYVNPNGLPADGQITSARDLGILARALIREFPEYESYWHISAIRFGKRVVRNYNALIDRYPGADGMKTGFICASGFNLVATATQNGKHLIAVVLGAPSSAVRAMHAVKLLERGFHSGSLSWLTPSLGTVDALTPIDAAPPNLRDEMCGPRRKRPAAEDDPVEATNDSDATPSFNLSSLRAPDGKPFSLSGPPTNAPEPIVVFIGPAKNAGGTKLASAPAAAAGKNAKPGAKSDAKTDAKTAAAKTAAVTPAAATPVAVKPVVAAKPGQIAPAPAGSGTPAVAAAGAIPWTSFSSTALADAPPPALASTLSETSTMVPLPLARPRVKPKSKPKAKHAAQ